jgi:ubiquinone/menaquinone biosynthesis C-methylase UbiE
MDPRYVGRNVNANEAQGKAAATYDAAADTYDDPANSFWARFGRRTVERLGLKPGERVLDACCGSGASALPAGEFVGASGSVLGIDLSHRLLDLARAKAHERGLAHVVFRAGDLLYLPVPAGSFDAVVCVFGVFFVADMGAAVRSLWRAVRPGGALAITTWGPRFFEPASSVFWNAIRDVRPDLHKAFHPWDRISDPASLDAVLRDGGVDSAEIVAESGEHPIPTPEAWWAAVRGSGYRGTLEQLTAAQRERVRSANLEFARRTNLRAIEANVVYALARKP